MYMTKITDEYDNITSSNHTIILKDYDNITSTNMTLSNCTNIENNIDIFIPALLFTIPCGLSYFCLISLMVYTLIKPLINK